MENLKNQCWYWIMLNEHTLPLPCQYYIDNDNKEGYFLTILKDEINVISFKDIKTIGSEII